ncbi:hypothetical protein [Geomesophilobacter sediminis]|uniref:Uncharacterized protein n=1 Tax=Geomesophilobacter sediminis TaxID=2798584 RepID=A0A8J7LY97_9BACT|nr:hypothetical protein [Geomesophilobacter sediminis]MBJ6724636.1 hypothetical protein [Geomesophilobacter sediminis]
MAKCNYSETCPFLNTKMPAMSLVTSGLLAQKYCDGNFTGCEIHKTATAEGMENVREDANPVEKAEVYNKVRNWISLGRYGW